MPKITCQRESLRNLAASANSKGQRKTIPNHFPFKIRTPNKILKYCRYNSLSREELV